MGRIYYVPFVAISVSAAQDLLEILPAANKPIALHWVRTTQSVSETSEQLRFALKRLTATVTSGSGGASVTPIKRVSSDAAAGATCERNNTTRATTSGTTEEFWAEGQNVLNGWDVLFTPETRPIFINGEALIVGLEVPPGAALTMSGVACIEELA